MYDRAVIGLFGLLGVAALVGVAMGAWHQLFMVAVCGVMVWTAAGELRRLKSNGELRIKN
jgi:hypothetical protein